MWLLMGNDVTLGVGFAARIHTLSSTRSRSMSRIVTTLLVLIPSFTFTVRAQADEKSDQLLEAAKQGDAARVKVLLEKGTDVNARNAYGASALTYAAEKGHLAVVELLLKHKADVNVRDKFYKATPLNWAFMKNRWDVVKVLIEAGSSGAEETLQGAALQGHTDIVRLILAKSKPQEAQLSQALAATPAKHAEIVTLLKDAGAKQVAPQIEVNVDAETLRAYAGTYRKDTMDLKIAVKGGKLTAQYDGAARLKAISKTTFVWEGFPVTLTFQLESDKVTGLVMKYDGDKTEIVFKRVEASTTLPAAPVKVVEEDRVVKSPRNWPSFRGLHASGVADGQFPPVRWDAEKDSNIRWKTPIPGLGLSCPIVWEDRVYLTTAVSANGKAALKTGQYGDVDSVKEAEQSWRVYCLDKNSGKILWEQTACKGVPKVKRHLKSSHANPTPATDGTHVVVSFGSEGLYCYDMDGKLLWQKSFGVLNSGWFYDADYQWGFGSSPIIYKNMVIVQCDVGKDSFLAAYHVASGKEIWRQTRDEIPSWGTPTIVEGSERVELVTNATKYARGYDPLTGAELWRLDRHSEITVPTPIYGAGLIFITSGYRPVQPIYAIRPGAKGDISLKGKTASDAIAWSTAKGGPYMPTPIVYGEHLYVCSNGGILTCFDAKSGKQVYKDRLGGQRGYTASPVAADGRIYFAGEDGVVTVVKAGPKFEILAANALDESCLATPAIADGMIFVRTQHHLFGIGRTRLAQK
jgi:outer membrane protein assembly factor BamB